jgi:hypothetical protein
VLRSVQDADYANLLENEQERRLAAEHAREEERVRRAAAAQERARIVALAAALAPEPERGVSIAVRLPDKVHRRRFAPADRGEAVYVWAISRAPEDVTALKLRFAGRDLSRGNTLEEQQITAATMFEVVADDD